jgi:NAD(P)-dependent dehydrogenase (short-subunit alcohol dehydrogenase family)
MMEIMNEPLGRLGKSEEVAEAAVWLCSDSASWVTGHAMPVDGGGMAGHIAVDQHALDLEKNAPQ